MSYNEIMQALENGLKVYWSNSAYKVFWIMASYMRLMFTIVQCVVYKNLNMKTVLLENEL